MAWNSYFDHRRETARREASALKKEREGRLGSRAEEWSSKETKRGAESKPDNEPAGGSAVVRRLRGGPTFAKIHFPAGSRSMI